MSITIQEAFEQGVAQVDKIVRDAISMNTQSVEGGVSEQQALTITIHAEHLRVRENGLAELMVEMPVPLYEVFAALDADLASRSKNMDGITNHIQYAVFNSTSNFYDSGRRIRGTIFTLSRDPCIFKGHTVTPVTGQETVTTIRQRLLVILQHVFHTKDPFTITLGEKDRECTFMRARAPSVNVVALSSGAYTQLVTLYPDFTPSWIMNPKDAQTTNFEVDIYFNRKLASHSGGRQFLSRLRGADAEYRDPGKTRGQNANNKTSRHNPYSRPIIPSDTSGSSSSKTGYWL